MSSIYTNKLKNSFFYKIALIADPNESFLNFGPKFIPLNTLINIHKGGTLFFILFCMYIFNNFSLSCYIYLSLHGSYGIIWILKDKIFPDKTFKIKVSLPVALLIQIVLLIYWSFSLIIVLKYSNQEISNLRIFFCFFIYILGLFLMICTDLQKYITLKYNKGLIKEYFLSKNRNTNYLGEMLIYLSFTMIINNILIYCILFLIWLSLFSCRIYLKEVSLSKKEGYEEYINNSNIIWFKLFSNKYLNILLVISIIIILILINIYT